MDDEDADLASIDVDRWIVAGQAITRRVETNAVGVDRLAHSIAECVDTAGCIEALLADEVRVEVIAIAGLADTNSWD